MKEGLASGYKIMDALSSTTASSAGEEVYSREQCTYVFYGRVYSHYLSPLMNIVYWFVSVI